MAKVMTYVDVRGTEFSASYWALTTVHIETLKAYGKFAWTGFRDKVARDTQLEAIGSYGFELLGADFIKWYTFHITNQIDIGKLAYLAVVDRKDTPDEPVLETSLSSDGSVIDVMVPRYKNFFNGAKDEV